MRLTGAPAMSHGEITVRPVRGSDASALSTELLVNRGWLQQWEATIPGPSTPLDARSGIRYLRRMSREGSGAAFVIEVGGEFAGQLNVSGLVHGAQSTATLGYWVAQRFAGRNATPTAVALVTDWLLGSVRLHRAEICVRPENLPSRRVVEKLGWRYEGLRRRFIHIDGDWRDHYCYAVTTEEVPNGVLHRWLSGGVDPRAAEVPERDLALAASPFPPRL